MTNHETKDCYYHQRGELDGRGGQLRQMERPRPVLGAQPPLLGIMTMRLAKIEEAKTSNEIVLATPYYDDDYHTDYGYEEDNTQPLLLMGVGHRKLPGCICKACSYPKWDMR